MESGPLHFFNRMAGTPSGPELELYDRSSIASITSWMVNIKSLSLDLTSDLLESNELISGLLKTDLYCLDRISAISKEELAYLLFASCKGPILLLRDEKLLV